MLSSQEQRVWDDVQRFWATEVPEPPGLAPSARGRRWVWRDPEELPVVVAAGVWLAVALVLFGAVLAGLAVLGATAVGWALWHNWPRWVRSAPARADNRGTEVSGMPTDLLDLYRQASDWAAAKVAGARDLEAATPCPEWRVRDLLNHMLDTQRYFAGAARGEKASLPAASPPSLLTTDPSADFARATAEVADAYAREGVVERTGPALGIAFSDQLLHGWDLAKATDQDATMPDGLAQAAYDCIHGRFTDEQRHGVFGPEIPVAGDATPQQRLLAYTGRDPH